MQLSDHFETISQSYLIEGDGETVLQQLVSILEAKHHIKTAGNPDFLVRSVPTLDIELAREIKEQASRRGSSDEKRIFIIQAGSFTREASNALLKTLEEPGEHTHFFLIVPSLQRILPTIISRCQVVREHSSVSVSPLISPKDFLTLSSPKRLVKIKEMLAKLDKEEIAKSEVHSFIEDLIRHQHEEQKEGRKGKLKKLSQSADIASYSRDTSASLKMVLEYLALSL